MKTMLGALAAITLLVGIGASQPAAAQERCWNNGYGWQCRYGHGDHHWWWRHHHHDRYWDRY